MAGNKMEDDRNNDRHGWKKNGNKAIIRIDHSDVYIENDRLGEDLEYTMANIHRSRYRQFLNRDSEITQLRRSLSRMRQNNAGTSVLSRASLGRVKAGANGSPATPTSSPTNDARPNPKPKEAGPGSRSRKSSLKQRRSGVVTAPPSARVKNILITMPDSDKNVSDSDSLSEDDDGGGGDNDDDEENDEDDLDLNLEESGDELHSSRPASRRKKKNQGKEQPQSQQQQRSKSKSRAYEDPYMYARRPPSLEKLMRMLKLEEIPPSWYTTVIPASDVSFHHRSGRSVLQELTNPATKPHDKSWYQPRATTHATTTMPLRKSTTTISPAETHRQHQQPQPQQPQQQQQRRDTLPLRPHTSLGMSWLPESANRQPGSSPRPGSRLSRPRTAMTSMTNPRSVSPSTKTLRQLKELSELEEQKTINSRPKTGLELMLDETKEKRKVIDQKISLFLESLDELQKAKRWKEQGLNVQPGRSALGFSSSMVSFSSVTVDTLSPGVHRGSPSWRGIHTPHDSLSINNVFKRTMPRPTTVA